MSTFQKPSEINTKLVLKQSELEQLFDIKLENILILSLSKSEFSKIELRDWVVGFTIPWRSLIVVINQDEMNRSYDDWLKVIVHEMSHLYYQAKLKTSEPTWLNEGIACHVAEQQKPLIDVSLKDLITYFKSNDKSIYQIGYSIVNQFFR